MTKWYGVPEGVEWEKEKTVEDITLDAQDAFYEFDDEQGNIFDDDDRLLFCEGFNQGMQAMKEAILTMLENEREHAPVQMEK